MTKKPTAAQIRARLSNPGERSKLSVKYLTPAQRQQRALNTRLDSPVTPGSSLSNRDLAHQASNATQLQYGPQEQAINANIAARQQTEKDTGDWFTAFQNDLRQHAANIAQINQGQQTQLDATTRAAAGTSAPGGAATPDDANAAAVRAKLAAIGSTLGSTIGATNQTYADTQANVVAPGQRLVGQLNARKDTQSVRDRLSALKGEEGAFNTRFRSDTVANEDKNVLAQQALTGRTAQEQADAALKAAGLAETVRSHRASERLSAQTTRERASERDSTPYSSGAFAGLTPAQVRALPDSKRAQMRAAYKKSGGSTRQPRPTSGPGSLTPAAEQKQVSLIERAYQALASPQTVQIPVTTAANGMTTTRPAKSPAEALAYLRSKTIDPRVLDVARSLYHNRGKGVGEMGVKAAHDLGIHVSGHWDIIQ